MLQFSVLLSLYFKEKPEYLENALQVFGIIRA